MTRLSLLMVLVLCLLGLQTGCGGSSDTPTEAPAPVTTDDQVGDSEANAPEEEIPLDADPLASVEVNEVEAGEATARPSVLLKLMIEPVGEVMESASGSFSGGLGL